MLLMKLNQPIRTAQVFCTVKKVLSCSHTLEGSTQQSLILAPFMVDNASETLTKLISQDRT